VLFVPFVVRGSFIRARKRMDLENVHEDALRGKILNIGLGTTVHVHISGLDGQFKSIMVGQEPQKYLMIRLPLLTGIINKLCEGNRAKVRYMYSGSVYGFLSTVLHYVDKPSSLLFLAYPKTVDVLESRRSRRVDCYFPGTATIREKECTGTVVDISTDGCKFSIDTSGEVGVPLIELEEDISLCFQLIGNSQLEPVLGKVRSLSRDGEKVVVGVHFNALDPETRKCIEVLIESFWPLEHKNFGME
jgi:c-di-GMP-binding flagellar brake protein YcgR